MRRIALLLLVSWTAFAVADDLETVVTRMARVGRASTPTFSPDGKQIAFIADLSGTPQVWIVPVTGGFPRMVTAAVDPVTFVRWSPASDELAFTLAPGGGMNTQIYAVKPDGSGLRRLTAGGRDNNNFSGWTDDGQRLTASSSVANPAAMDAYLLDPATAKLELAAKNEGVGGIENVSRDRRRAVLQRVRSRSDSNLYLLDLASHAETLLTPHTGPASFAGEIAPDGNTVYVLTNNGRDLAAFGRIRIAADGKPGAIEILAERADAELDGFQLDHDGTRAVLVWNVAGRTEISFYNVKRASAAHGNVRLSIGGRGEPGPKLPGELAGGFQFSRDGSKLALTISGAAAPPDVWLYDFATQELTQLTFSPHPGVNLADFVRPRLVKFKAHDGLELSGWLYEPKRETKNAKPAPYVLSFHGGPEGQERPAFRSDYQGLVAQGIGVFAPNVRGSSGFGKRYVNLDNGELRFNGIQDIKSCVDYLVSSGVADPKRIGITGGSYGGYMTMVGVTFYPELFAAGVDLFGMVNFATFFEHTEPWMAAISTIEYGDPKTQADLLARLSPLGKLDQIKAAMMVQHGANDTNVPVVEAEQIVDNLKRRGVPVEYIKFPDEGHGWRKVPNRIRSTVELVRFFSQHLGAAPAAAAQ
jgi:dipeptidyl aminopeptidase/acylaminoacyl peptidase